MKRPALTITHLYTFVGEKQILFDISCSFEAGKITVLMGPNGSGKSTLAHVIMGDPKYKIQNSKIKIQKLISRIYLGAKEITDLPTEKRARMGLFLSFQSPVAITGVSVIEILKTVLQEQGKAIPLTTILKTIRTHAASLHIAPSLLTRGIHDGFSGGERKKIELLQALVLKPTYAIFDEIDTGVDIDALKSIAGGIQKLKNQGTGVVLITHNDRILRYVDVDAVLVMKNGKIVQEGKKDLLRKIHNKGYGQW